MKSFLNEIYEELALVLTGKTLDILAPPVLFYGLYTFGSLLVALVGSLLLSIVFLGLRLYKNENKWYAFGGLVAVILAIGFAYINNNASNFFIPDIIGTATLIIITTGSLILGKPLAIWVSHITRGWDLKWFFRDDVKPAYTHVTIFWLGFFIIRLSVELYLYTQQSVDDLIIANVIMGYPVLIIVLVISYVYGVTTLHRLGGPGVDEFISGKKPPYRGQTRGF
ncbi:DUF3159 domain-containing protein [Candidatus Xianfuyuplasma coldseepsis]|uniref:DUF3159 domain-containing protein n=1 Tax=Candidatus Xianfuyuplasma coldseepsis TaxID=2782163 RepID=A0A7L7KQ33_9MOLU|nr:DUF3159 domain-containing protein [Xianfuyuplasma coldseepsis]QMS84685.1 DUF3159 domain-containing protein [Xianfuyuplasma coldseepsis]